MNKSSTNNIILCLQFLMIWIMVVLSENVQASNIDKFLNSENDSLKSLFNSCNTDTCKFDILKNIVWKTAPEDIERVKYVGQQAYQLIKNSQNKRALSDGYDIKGILMMIEEDFDSAHYYYNKALKTSKKIQYNHRIAWSYFKLGDLNNILNNKEVAIDDMKKAIVCYYTDKDTLRAMMSTWYLANLYQTINYDSSLFYYEKRLELFKDFPNTRLEVILCLEMANFYRNHENLQKSLALINRVLNIAEKEKDIKEIGYIYWVIGDFFFNNNERISNIAFEYYLKALTICNEINNQFLEAIIYNRIGNYYLKEGKDSLALENQQYSLKLSKELNHKRRIAVALKGLGYAHKNLENYQLAIDNYLLYMKIGSQIFNDIVFHPVLIEIGDLYNHLNNPDKSLEYYNKSLDLANKFNAKKEMAISYFKIGKYYNETDKEYTEKNFLKAFDYAMEANSMAEIKNVTNALSRYYFDKKKYMQAIHFMRITQAFKDSIETSNRYANIAELEMKFEIEKAKKENKANQLLAKEELKRQKIYRNFSILIALLVFGIGIFLYLSYKRKKKDNLLLIAQKNEISEKSQEIKAQIEEIERISKKLHETDQTKLRFFSNISHEIRTPLTLILNPLQNFIRSFKGNWEQKKQLSLIYNNADRLKELADQILDLQKLDTGNLILHPERGDIVAHLKGIVSSFEGFCSKKGCKLFLNSKFTSLYCSFDKDKITKVVSNLLSNAFKYSDKQKGEIQVDFSLNENNINLLVKDNGKGIPEESLKNIFKRYYQVETSNTQPQGTGIGLAYVKELVELMNGQVIIESELNKGTTVKIGIPISDYKIVNTLPFKIEVQPDKRRSIDDQIAKVLNIESNKDNKPSILITEDNEDLRNYIGDLFKDEFYIIYAKNGKEGIKNAFNYLPDIIISDIMMPDTDGLEMCSTLKQDEQTSHIPIIMLTAKDNFKSNVEGYQSGADDYIIKPFDSSLLKLKVQNIITTKESIRKQFGFENGNLKNNTKYSDIDKLFLKKCIDIINKNLDNPNLTVDNLSNELSFSRRNLYRKLQALTNYNPAELIRDLRMRHAANLLKSTNLRVFEIAMSVGYDNTAHFSQTFKKQFGVLPSEYMNKN